MPTRVSSELPAPDCATREVQGDGHIGQVVYRQNGIWLHDLDTGERTAFPEGERFLEPEPSDWSPDGGWRAFALEDGSLWIESADGEQRQEILPPGSGVRGSVYWAVSPVYWSPDGEWIAYLVSQGKTDLGHSEYLGIWRVHPDGSEHAEIYAPSDTLVEQPELMGWSPDGQVILFRKGMYHSASGRADGLEIHALPREGGNPRLLGTSLLNPDFLAWSPARDCLALTDGGGREVWYNKQIVVAAPDGSARANLSNDSSRADVQPAWSPDARKIAYVSRPVPEQYPLMTEAIYDTDIWLMNVDGTEKHQLTFTENAGEHYPLWSPDGEHILFVRVENNRSGLWIMETDGGKQRQVAELGAAPPPPSNYYGHIDLTGLYAWYLKGG
ncbi:MAG: PD40 domain-containing protein [Chloroflexi bacterium]|nr:PD40 domain-containing protein [Chloroflexota bacterium]